MQFYTKQIAMISKYLVYSVVKQIKWNEQEECQISEWKYDKVESCLSVIVVGGKSRDLEGKQERSHLNVNAS